MRRSYAPGNRHMYVQTDKSIIITLHMCAVGSLINIPFGIVAYCVIRAIMIMEMPAPSTMTTDNRHTELY